MNTRASGTKKYMVLLIASLTALASTAQDITGRWYGFLKVQGTQSEILLNIVQTENGLSAALYGKDTGSKDLTVTNIFFDEPKIAFKVSDLKIEYNGELKDGKIIGTVKQDGQEFPMDLSRERIGKKGIARPQEPLRPYPYSSEDVTFENTKANITLSGTLTLPRDGAGFPVVILISGSDSLSRDGQGYSGHRPFLVISDHLTRNGIGVLRYDDRGAGQSGGEFYPATSADHATDVESAIEYLKTRKEADKSKIGLIGHSAGGLVASIAASKSEEVSFIVLLAAPGIPGYDNVVLQAELMNAVHGKDDLEFQRELAFLKRVLRTVIETNDGDDVKSILTDSIKKEMIARPELVPKSMEATDLDFFVRMFAAPWLQYYLKNDPSSILANVKCPVLALNGEKDLQVPPKNLTAIENALIEGGNEDITIKEFPDLNHLFQESFTGSSAEYIYIEQTFSPIVLEEITSWIKTLTR